MVQTIYPKMLIVVNHTSFSTQVISNNCGLTTDSRVLVGLESFGRHVWKNPALKSWPQTGYSLAKLLDFFRLPYIQVVLCDKSMKRIAYEAFPAGCTWTSPTQRPADRHSWLWHFPVTPLEGWWSMICHPKMSRLHIVIHTCAYVCTDAHTYI